MNLDRIPHDRVGFGSTVHLKDATGETIDLSARHARRRGCGARDDLDGLADRPRPPQQGGRRRGTSSRRPTAAAVRAREARDHPRRGRSNRSTISVITPDTPDRVVFHAAPHRARADRLGHRGAYHAGVLRALHEAGVKLDLVAGRGIGVVGALFAAVDGGAAALGARRDLEGGRRRASSIGWRAPLRVAGWALAVAAAVLAIPLVLLALAVVLAIIGLLLTLVGLSGAATAVTSGYAPGSRRLFAPTALPTVIPRLALFAGLVALGALAVGRARRRRREAEPPPVPTGNRRPRCFRARSRPTTVANRCAAELWNLIRGAAPIPTPPHGRARATVSRAARREPRAAGIPRAARHGPRHRRAPRPGVRAAPAALPPALLRACLGCRGRAPGGGIARGRASVERSTREPPARGVRSGRRGARSRARRAGRRARAAGRYRAAPPDVRAGRALARRNAPRVRSPGQPGAAARGSGARRVRSR